MKNLFVFLSLMLFMSCAKKEDVNIKGSYIKNYPNVDIENIKKIDENFHEIIINNQIYYATNDGKFFDEYAS